MQQQGGVDEPEETEPSVARAVLEDIGDVERGRQGAESVSAKRAGDGLRPDRFFIGQTLKTPEEFNPHGGGGAGVLEFGFYL